MFIKILALGNAYLSGGKAGTLHIRRGSVPLSVSVPGSPRVPLGV
jgi:hypothetical protein